MTRCRLLFLLTLCLPACASPSPEATTVVADAPVAPRAFINKVWRVVHASNGTQPGQLYTFLSEGTLVIASDTGTPALGKWSYVDGAFTMVEEGRPYPVRIDAQTAASFVITINGPGTPIELQFVLAAGAAVP